MRNDLIIKESLSFGRNRQTKQLIGAATLKQLFMMQATITQSEKRHEFKSVLEKSL